MSLLKRENGIGFVKGTTWGTAVEPGTLNGIIVKSHSAGVNERDVFINDEEYDHDMPTIQTLGNYPAVTGSMVLPFYYEGVEPILASMFGKYAGVDTAGIITHNYEYDPVISGLFHTIGYDEGDEVKAVESAVLNSMKMSVDDGMSLDVGYIGDKVAVESGFTTPLNLTYPTTGVDKFKLLEATVSINAQDGSDFVGGDEVCVNNVEVNIERGFEALEHCAGDEYIKEPIEVKAPVMSITLNFPKKDAKNKAYFGDFANGSLKKMKIKFTGSLISGSDYYDFEMNFPMLRIKSAVNYEQDSPIPATVELEVLKASSAPTGMSKIVPYATLINERAVLTGYPSI